MVSPSGPGHLDRRAVVIAGYNGNVAVVRSALGHADDGVRAAALGALARQSALEGSDILRALGDRSHTVQRRAVELAAKPFDPRDGAAITVRIDDALIEMLARGAASDPADEHGAVLAEVAAWSLGERHENGEDAAPEAIVRALCTATTDHADPLVREAAVAALGAIGCERALAAVLQACSDRATVRRRAVLALAAFTGPDVEAALARATSDRDWQVRQAAEDLLRPSEDRLF